MNLKLSGFCQTVDALCKRPTMYTTNGSYGEIVALIDGLAGGARLLPEAGHHPLASFHVWLAKTGRFSDEQRFVGYGKFRQQFENDKDALKEFAILFRNFCSELPVEEDTITITLTESEAQEILVLFGNLKLQDNKKLLGFRALIQQNLESFQEGREFWHELFKDIRLFPE